MNETTSREDHLKWCKDRALRELEFYLRTEPGAAVNNAYASFASDMNKHDDTRDHSAITLGLMLMLGGQLKTPESIREYILGFN